MAVKSFKWTNELSVTVPEQHDGKPVTEAHELAVKVSAFVCTQNGAMPTLTPELLAAAR